MANRLRCPRDRTDLATESSDGFRVDRCPRCAGLVVTVAMLRRIAPADRVNSLWRAVSTGTRGDACPSCTQPLIVASVHHGERVIEIDACRTCQLLWFDADELEAFSPTGSRPPRTAPKDRLSPAAAEAMALSEMELRRQSRKPPVASAVTVDVVIGVLEELLWLPFV